MKHPLADPAWKKALLDWYRRHKRDLPWRRTSELYPVWVSEVMLQQTQVATVLPYYERWMRRFPDLETLAKSTEQDVLAVWQGMGYYRRAKYLRLGAQWVLEHGVPQTVDAWLEAPGVGPYTAAALASIVQGLPAAVVDGNVERVFARFTANDGLGPHLLKAARGWANDVIDRQNPADWNQAMMELGATVCTPRNPKCPDCPLEPSCVARQTWSVDRYPASKSAAKPVREEHIVWVPICDGRFGIRQIPPGQWWESLWEFPRARKGCEDDLRSFLGEGWLEALGTVRHQVTQHKIEIEASLIRCSHRSPELAWKEFHELAEVPMPSPQRKILRLAQVALGLTDGRSGVS